jgi:octaheme c-type cytochrome (tetrathionate reductase family)
MNSHGTERIRKPLFTHGSAVLLTLMGIGFAFGLTRMFAGLNAVTNLDNFYPWGIWIAIDVACGVALAAGGFTTAAFVEIFGKHEFKPLLRPAILTAWLGYAMVAFGLLFDLGRYWNIWRPLFNWQGNSGLFEVAMCVMAYLTVLTIEMSPSFLEGLKERIGTEGLGGKLLTHLEKPLIIVHRAVKVVLPIFIIAGVVLSFMHQSSLGTIILLTPTKTHSLWFTPILPLLFLISAIMVGFPMVILESLIANKVFGRASEIHLLEKLAKLVPWFIGLYALLKFGDLAVRFRSIDFFGNAMYTTVFFIEVIAGVVLPFYLFTRSWVRRSKSLLFISSLLVIFGIVLNRINVYLTAYDPPFATGKYFPAIGEIMFTIGMVATLMFLYRIVVTLFPVVQRCTCGECEARYKREEEELKKSLSIGWVRLLQGGAVIVLLVFVFFYTFVHKQALAGTISAFNWANKVAPVKKAPVELTPTSHLFRPEGYANLYMLDNEILNTATDFYEPARFTHRTHDVVTDGNCGVCHHRFSMDEEDRIGEDVKEFHMEFDVRIANAPCGSCHDMEDIYVQKCSTCHWLPGEADDLNRLGLKGAYHQQCIGCHEAQPDSQRAPVDCLSCHHPYTPDHSELVELSLNPSIAEVTGNCLSCHEQTGEDVLRSAHWTWQGLSPRISGHEHEMTLGRKTVFNNCSFAMGADDAACAQCHIGYGWDEGRFDFGDAQKIDCLVCHDTTDTYRKGWGGHPLESVDLARVAAQVGRPSRATCGTCHFNSGGGANFKHGDLEPILADAPDGFDVHMGRYDLRCQDCHTTFEHKIAGESMTSPVVEGRVECYQCHGNSPHGISGTLSRHLDDHTRTVACETCHIPFIAKETPTRVSVDFSQAGKDQPVISDELGKPLYDKKIGAQKWAKNLVPEYLWYDGTREAHIIGDKIDPSGAVDLNRPLGERIDPTARIYPFKVHSAIQPYDTELSILVVPRFEKGFWVHYDWDKAIAEGMEILELEYSGSHDFVETRMYTSIHHEVAPTRESLGCADCHSQKAVTCSRCHAEDIGNDMPEHARSIYPDIPKRMDFKKLGYSDDPAVTGGRLFINRRR